MSVRIPCAVPDLRQARLPRPFGPTIGGWCSLHETIPRQNCLEAYFRLSSSSRSNPSSRGSHDRRHAEIRDGRFRVARRGPDLHHRARAATPTTSRRTACCTAIVLRSPVAKGALHDRLDRSGQGSARRASGADRRRSRASRRPAFGRHAETARRHPRADPRHSDPVPRPRQLCRRRGRLRRRRQPRAGAGRRRADRGRLRCRGRGGRHRDRARPGGRRWSGRNSARNRAFLYELGDKAKTEAAFARAAKVTSASSSSTTGWSATTWSRARRSASGSRTRTASC